MMENVDQSMEPIVTTYYLNHEQKKSSSPWTSASLFIETSNHLGLQSLSYMCLQQLCVAMSFSSNLMLERRQNLYK